MSMINDALRRASSAAKTVPGASATPEASPALPPMPLPESSPLPPPLYSAASPSESYASTPPVMRVESPRKKSVFPVVIAMFIVLCLFGGGGFYFWQKQQRITVSAKEKDSQAQPRRLSGGERPAVASAAIDTPSGENTAIRSNLPVAAATSKPVVTAPVPVVPAAPVVPAVPVKFPPLRLQSIFYRPANPSVIINGKTLFVTDEISGVKVADIQPANVTLVLSGQTNVLTLR